MKSPKTLVEAVRYYGNPAHCLTAMVEARWPDGTVTCPTCGNTHVRWIATRQLWECNTRHPRKQFSVKVGTIFEDSPLGLDKWLPVVWLIANAKNGISSYEVARALGVTQKTGWFMLHRIRLAMQTGTFTKMKGEVEVDETFIGGRARFMHRQERERKITGTGGMGKTAVMGLLERHGHDKPSQARVMVVGNRRKPLLQATVRQNVATGSNLYSDALKSYEGLEREYTHQVIDHAETYVRGNVHTNGLENFWSLLKRGIKGTYVSVAPFHLFRYLDEEAFRFNERRDPDGDSGRFAHVLKSTVGRRVMYKQLTGKTLGLNPA
jgi:transposase-like protein